MVKPKTKSYVDNNPKTVMGTAKPSFFSIPPQALIYLGQAMKNGKDKYGLKNWREKKVTYSVYHDAMMRHLLACQDGEDNARDSLVHHLGHIMAGCAIVLDAMENGSLVDDRGIPGNFSDMVERLTSTYMPMPTKKKKPAVKKAVKK